VTLRRSGGSPARAEEWFITEHTVSNYLFNIYNKLGISSRVELGPLYNETAGSTCRHRLAVLSLLWALGVEGQKATFR